MNGLPLIAWLVLAQMPTVQVTTLAGDQHEGLMESFTTEAIVVKTSQASVAIPAGELLMVQAKNDINPVVETSIELRLVDETRLFVKSFQSSGTAANVVHARLGEFSIPTDRIASVRFRTDDQKVDAEWNQMTGRGGRKDVLAIRKGDALDHLDGIIGTLNESTMQFQLDGTEIAVKRDKIFGLIYSRRESTAKKAVARLETNDGDRLAIRHIEFSDNRWQVLTVSGLPIAVGFDQFQRLDFSSGKVTYFSDIEPRSVKYTDRFGVQFPSPLNEYRRDKGYDGHPIMLNRKPYSKGLAIHARTAIKYRPGGDYRRFQALVGIGDEYPEGNVNLVITGDNKPLWKSSVAAIGRNSKGRLIRNAPQNLDLDITGVVDLEILVDFGNDPKHVGEVLYLANAKAIK